MTIKPTHASAAFLAAAVCVALIGVAAASAVAESADTAAPPTAAVEALASAESPGVTTDAAALSDAEAGGILFMREEEKLARDVYLGLGELWDLRIFENIAASEQRHMDAILGLIETYGLTDPPTAGTIGVFENDDLQALYDGLMSMGAQSVEAALEVGATVEEVDIADLTEYLADATAPDVVAVYENLLRGSRNHLRAFDRQLSAAGIDRAATVLDPAVYEAIIRTETERGGEGAAAHQEPGERRRGGGGPNGQGFGGGQGGGRGWGGSG